MKVMFLPSGNTVVFRDGRQVPDLQKSWVMLYVQALISVGIDVEQVDFTMPDARHAKVVNSLDGRLNWEIDNA